MDSSKNHVSGRFWVVLQVYLVPGNNPYIPGKLSISSWRSQRPEVSCSTPVRLLFDSCSTPVRLLFDSEASLNGVRTQNLTLEFC